MEETKIEINKNISQTTPTEINATKEVERKENKKLKRGIYGRAINNQN